VGKYRKKPVVIDAEPIELILYKMRHDFWKQPEWVITAYEDGKLIAAPEGIYIKTLEGSMFGGKHDWLLQGVNGELYPCKDNIFKLTYEEVKEVISDEQCEMQ